MPKINVLSLDFDGCVFNKPYINSTASDRLIANNQPLFEAIIQDLNIEQYQQAILMVGSNRQDNTVNMENMTKFTSNGLVTTESCFPALRQLKDHLQSKTPIPVSTDEYLLADTYGHVEPGTSFDLAFRALNKEQFAKSHPMWVFDESKVSLLYAQMHHIANKYPNDEIVFDFYDDREDILKGLQKFYSDNKDLIPCRVTLRLHQYNGAFDNNGSLQAIVGTEDHDIDHHTSIKLMAHLTQMLYVTRDGHIKGGNTMYNFIYALQEEKLADFKKWRRREISVEEFKAKYPLTKVEYCYYREITTTGATTATPASLPATPPVLTPPIIKAENTNKFNFLQLLRKHALLIAVSALLALAAIAIFCIPIVGQTLGTATFTGWLINNIALGLSFGGIATTASLITAQILATTCTALLAFILPIGAYMTGKALFTKPVRSTEENEPLLASSSQQMAVMGGSTGSPAAHDPQPPVTPSPISQPATGSGSASVNPTPGIGAVQTQNRL